MIERHEDIEPYTDIDLQHGMIAFVYALNGYVSGDNTCMVVPNTRIISPYVLTQESYVVIGMAIVSIPDMSNYESTTNILDEEKLSTVGGYLLGDWTERMLAAIAPMSPNDDALNTSMVYVQDMFVNSWLAIMNRDYEHAFSCMAVANTMKALIAEGSVNVPVTNSFRRETHKINPKSIRI